MLLESFVVVGVVDEAVVVVSAVVLSEVVGTTVEVRFVDSEVTTVDVVGSFVVVDVVDEAVFVVSAVVLLKLYAPQLK